MEIRLHFSQTLTKHSERVPISMVRSSRCNSLDLINGLEGQAWEMKGQTEREGSTSRFSSIQKCPYVPKGGII
jgi:hypothetical protein